MPGLGHCFTVISHGAGSQLPHLDVRQRVAHPEARRGVAAEVRGRTVPGARSGMACGGVDQLAAVCWKVGYQHGYFATNSTTMACHSWSRNIYISCISCIPNFLQKANLLLQYIFFTGGLPVPETFIPKWAHLIYEPVNLPWLFSTCDPWGDHLINEYQLLVPKGHLTIMLN